MSKEITLLEKSEITSISRLKETKVLTFCGMMGTLAIVLGYVATIKMGQYIRIGFSGLPNQVVDYLFGPWIGAIFGGAMDINKPLKLSNIIISQALVKIFCNIVLNTLWLNMLYGQAIAAILPGRIISNAVMLPIDCFIMYTMLKVVSKVIKPYFG